MKFNASRKYRIALLSLFLVTAGYLATHFSDRLKESYFHLIVGVETVLTLYGAANVGNKWVLAKNGVLVSQEVTETETTNGDIKVKATKQEIKDPSGDNG